MKVHNVEVCIFYFSFVLNTADSTCQATQICILGCGSRLDTLENTYVSTYFETPKPTQSDHAHQTPSRLTRAVAVNFSR